MDRREYFSHVENMAVWTTDQVLVEEPDERTGGALNDDPMIRWIDGIACKGAITEAVFILKGLEKVVVDGRTFPQYVREHEAGTHFEVTYDYIDEYFIRKVHFKMYLVRKRERSYPEILHFTYYKVEKFLK